MFMASQEALVEASLKATELGYQHVIFLSDHRNMEHI